MGYINVTADVDIDYDDISDQDICDILEDRIDSYIRKIESKRMKQSELKEFITDISDILSDALEKQGIAPSQVSSDKTLLDDMYDEVFKEMRDKFTLEQVTNFLKTK